MNVLADSALGELLNFVGLLEISLIVKGRALKTLMPE
jgi:hypothetical protein